ncbi:AI-2E family transporter [Roseateles chitinivorans]|uniref:AI-2E family transporter n=1 Tax=Roseateles chitinivorans TaxID=2917965 RepID=UPI003D67E3D6
MTQAAPSSPLAGKFLIGVSVLGLLYLGREVLVPMTLAGTLAFVLAPFVRRFRRLGLGQTAAALSALLLAGCFVGVVGAALLGQLSAMSRELPAYEANLQEKLTTLRKLTVDQLEEAHGRAGRMMGNFRSSASQTAGAAGGVDPEEPVLRQTTAPTEPPDRGADALRRLAAAVWGPAATVGIVILVLIFSLLEQDVLRDRLIRLLGGSDIRAATSAVNDAGQRLSRYFISQFTVNLGVAVVIGVLLAVLGMPHAVIWAVLAGVLRFIPYVGFPAAALGACAVAAGVSPGWDLAWATALVFLAVELVVAHVLEPRLYGHATGLSPLSVVVAAIFWSALWGPVGLLLSTPLTLCLVVAGRHVPALAFLDILLGDTPALSLAQRFYQRSLSGDAVEILADARAFLKRKSLATYCDKVVLPALNLGRDDLARNLITQQQRSAAQRVILHVLGELTRLPHAPKRRWTRSMLFGGDLGLQLRQDRLSIEAGSAGRPAAGAGAALICISMDDREAHLSAELLVRILRGDQLDARHVTVQELADVAGMAAGLDVAAVQAVLVVAAAADGAVEGDAQALNERLARWPQARVISMFSANRTSVDQIAPDRPHDTVFSFEEAIALLKRTELPVLPVADTGAGRGE